MLREPKPTCPKINEIISIVQDSDADDSVKQEVEHLCEDVRQANMDLRDFVQAYYDKCDEIDNLQDDIERLRSEVSDLQDRLE